MTHESDEAEKPRPRWMWGRATFTIVVSSTTMSWAVRITKRKTAGFWRRRERGRSAWPWAAERGLERRERGIDLDLFAGILRTGRFLRLVYGGCLRLASPNFRGVPEQYEGPAR